MKTINSRHCVKFIDYAKSGSHIYIFMEKCTDGSLSDYLRKNNGNLPIKECVRLY